MTRPIYQTPEQRTRERWFGALTACKWGCEFEQMPDLNSYDLKLFRKNQLMALLEIKTRDFPSKKYPTFIVSSSKWNTIKKAGIELGVPVFLVVAYHDVFVFIKVDFDPDTHMGGRYDRGDAADEELMVRIPLKSFKYVGTVSQSASGK